MFEHLNVMGDHTVGCAVYSPDIIARAFEYFATSRSTYHRLCYDYQLPSIRTLTRITSKINSQDDLTFLSSVLSNLDEKKNNCVLLIDEVYVKAALLYQSGSIFGKAVNYPEKLATTILSFMVKSLFGGPEFLARVLPVSNLTSDFQLEQCKLIVDTIESSMSNGKVIAIITDGNKVNQSFFSKFKTVDGKPWLCQNGSYILYDYVHLLKCIRNNWLTEKLGQLQFTHNEITYIANWRDLVHLYTLEKNQLIKLSKLTETSINPKPIERQKVSTCLQVFSEETVAALKTHPKIDQESVKGTIIFLELIIEFWKIVNVKCPGANARFRDESRNVIRSSDDINLKKLLAIATMAEYMKPTSSKRIRQLTRDTSNALSHTCRGLIDLSCHLLSSGNEYVILGWFSSDPIEKCFGKLRQGSGGTYFITAKSVIEKVRIQHAKLVLQLNIEVGGNDGHDCLLCLKDLDDMEIDIIYNLPNLEDCINIEIFYAIVYIAGYVQKSST
jgi:hypothetical protein